MEAQGEPQHRTKVNPRKAPRAWASAQASATPHIQSWLGSSGGGGGGTLRALTRGDLHRSATCGRTCERKDARPKPVEKSDRPVVARKPTKVGGAKEATR